MRRNVVIGVAVVVLLAGIGLGAYHVGLSRGVAEQLEASGQLVPIDGPGFGRGYGVVVSEGAGEGDADVVRVLGPGFGRGYGYGPGFGFFPFGLLWIGLIVFGLSALGRRRRGWGPGPGHLDDWHRRQHEPASAEDR
ncbi:MAG: hypothetical protein ACRD0K_17390 [Egibacteraceae bacterium]